MTQAEAAAGAAARGPDGSPSKSKSETSAENPAGGPWTPRAQRRAARAARREAAPFRPEPSYEPDPVKGASLALQLKLKRLGVDVRVVPTGYLSHNQQFPQLKELSFPGATSAQLAGLRSNRAALGAVAQELGVSPERLRFDRLPGGAGYVAGTEPPEPLRPPSPTRTPGDFVTHHNQALDAWAYAKRTGTIGDGNTLVHVDSHSDLGGAGVPREAIGDYVNRAVLDGTVREIYWIVPEDLPPAQYAPDHALALERPPPYDFTLWKTPDGKTQLTPPEPGASEGFEAIPVHVRTAAGLDVAALNRGPPVLLDIDVDYFSNSGRDTTEEFGSNASRVDLNRRLNAFTDALSPLRPAYSTIALSPEYTSRDDHAAAAAHLRRWLPGNDLPERIGAYGHGFAAVLDERWIRHAFELAERGDRTLDRVLRDEMKRRGYEDVARGYLDFTSGRMSVEAWKALLGAAVRDVRKRISPS